MSALIQACKEHGVIAIADSEYASLTTPRSCSRCGADLPVVELSWEAWEQLHPLLRTWERAS